jgi:ribosomal protein S18 acetylase RimI-like enzyme
MPQTVTDIAIVPARPEHAGFIGWVMLAAARSHLERGSWDMMTGADEPTTLRFLEALSAAPEPHFMHHSLFLVAEVGGRPAAALAGYFDEENPPTSILTPLPAAAKTIGMTFEQVMGIWQQGGATIMNVSPEHVPGAWVVEHVATVPEFRRQGLVDRLLAAMIDRGRERGATVADIGVLIGNDRAQLAYEKAGFRVIDEKLDAGFEAAYGCTGIRALSRTI